jgi:hypothetical protein
MVILLLVMLLNENASRCANIRGVDQPFEGGLVMAVYRISEPVRTLVGLTGNKHRETHNATKTPTYKTWVCMKGRCLTENHIEYPRYGGRGISICERWLSFENFLSDMGERPEKCSIERIDNNGNYEPTNCRWATDKEQARNRRNSRLLTIDGVTKTVVEWSEQQGATRAANIYNRLDLGWPDGEAVFGRQACKN